MTGAAYNDWFEYSNRQEEDIVQGELIDRAEAIRGRVLQLRDSL